MSLYKIQNPNRKVSVEFSPDILIEAIEVARYRRPALAKRLIDIYENLEGQEFNTKKEKMIVRKC